MSSGSALWGSNLAEARTTDCFLLKAIACPKGFYWNRGIPPCGAGHTRLVDKGSLKAFVTLSSGPCITIVIIYTLFWPPTIPQRLRAGVARSVQWTVHTEPKGAPPTPLPTYRTDQHSPSGSTRMDAQPSKALGFSKGSKKCSSHIFHLNGKYLFRKWWLSSELIYVEYHKRLAHRNYQPQKWWIRSMFLKKVLWYDSRNAENSPPGTDLQRWCV